MKARMTDAWPAPEAFVQVLLSPDAEAVKGTCVIESVDEATGCE